MSALMGLLVVGGVLKHAVL